VYDRATSLRWAAFEARQLSKGDAIFVVLDPNFRSVGVVVSGSGRHASTRVSVRARRLAMQLFPGARKPRVTNQAPARGRITRKPKKPRWR